MQRWRSPPPPRAPSCPCRWRPPRLRPRRRSGARARPAEPRLPKVKRPPRRLIPRPGGGPRSRGGGTRLAVLEFFVQYQMNGTLYLAFVIKRILEKRNFIRKLRCKCPLSNYVSIESPSSSWVCAAERCFPREPLIINLVFGKSPLRQIDKVLCLIAFSPNFSCTLILVNGGNFPAALTSVSYQFPIQSLISFRKCENGSLFLSPPPPRPFCLFQSRPVLERRFVVGLAHIKSTLF